MASVTNTRALFKELVQPGSFIEPGKTFVCDNSETIDLDNVPLNGGFLVKVLELSVDIYLCARTRPSLNQSSIVPYTLGQPIDGTGVGVVLRSENAAFKQGDHVYGNLPYQNYAIINDAQDLIIVENKYKLPWSAFVGPAGLSGLTAYAGWKEYSRAGKGETVFVSSGAGPVGCVVIQLAKVEGLRVIASAGSDEKVELMKESGADVVVNYKTGSIKDTLEKEGPIDIYWDNVGGETLDLALQFSSFGARFIECGMLSGYGTGDFTLKNAFYIISKALSINGFIMTPLAPKYGAQFYDEVPKLIAEGKMKYREEVYNGLEKVGEAMSAAQQYTNKAKVVVHVADD
ncbi:alcohol dehydrogenase [Cyathus striatus]|nr:alcohol dehydrogenase [Cyathus striatus]